MLHKTRRAQPTESHPNANVLDAERLDAPDRILELFPRFLQIALHVRLDVEAAVLAAASTALDGRGDRKSVV